MATSRPTVVPNATPPRIIAVARLRLLRYDKLAAARATMPAAKTAMANHTTRAAVVGVTLRSQADRSSNLPLAGGFCVESWRPSSVNHQVQREALNGPLLEQRAVRRVTTNGWPYAWC
jgi:galactose mutarotase-like enzyme